MKNHFDLSDKEFENQFATCKLDPSIFNHEAHLRLAWIHITNYGVDIAEKNIQEQLKAYVNFLGETDKYHKTLTIVAIRAVYHCMQQSKTDNFKNFINEYSKLNSDLKAIVNSHYSFDIFTNPKARTEFLEPDTLPFS